jgi:regulator of sigma E protease
MLLTIVSFVIVLGVLVFFHELGHYWVARRSGIEVEEFGMGYPPRLVKLFRYDGTDFTLNLIPFGGFARMKGEDMSDMAAGSFNAASAAARAAVLVAGPAMNAILAVVLFAASFMAGFPAVAGYAQVTAVSAGSAAAEAGVQPGDVLIALNGRPVLVSAVSSFDYDVVARKEGDPNARTLTVMRGGQLVTLPLERSVSQEQLLANVTFVPVLATQIAGVAADSPAEQADLRPGDLVYAINDEVIGEHNPLNEAVQRYLGEKVTLSVLRGDQWVTVSATPRVNPPAGQGALGVQIGAASTLATLPLLPALWQGVVSTLDYVVLVLQLPALLIMGRVAPADAQLTGPVGIAQMVGGAVSATMDTGLWFPIWRLSAVLSAALAVTNLLPLPALDGGRLLFVLFEAMRGGRRVNPEREGMIHMVGFMLLLGLLALVTVRDITAAQQGIDWISILGQ